MNRLLTSMSVLAATAGGAFAGGLDRTGQPIQSLFEPGGANGHYVELGYARTYVNLDGEGVGIDSYSKADPSLAFLDVLPGTTYSNVGNDFSSLSGTLKFQFTDQLSGAIIFEQPYGSDVSYSGDPMSTELGGTSTVAETSSATFYLRYKFDDRWGLHGGLRLQKAKGDITLSGRAYGLPGDVAFATASDYAAGAAQAQTAAISAAAAAEAAGAAAAQAAAAGMADVAAQYQAAAEQYAAGAKQAGAMAEQAAGAAQTVAETVNGYNVELEEDYAVGYVIGASYEIPEIAARVSLTYNSAITHEMKTRETGPEIFGIGSIFDGTSTTEVKTPQSVNLEFRTGIAADTLLFGSVRWVDWSEFKIDPKYFTEATGEGLVELDDTTTWALGIGRRFTDNWAGSVAMSYEAPGDDLVSPLAPSTGATSVSVGASYTMNDVSITAGVRHTWLGDAYAETGTPDVKRAYFSGNSATSVGVRIGYNF